MLCYALLCRDSPLLNSASAIDIMRHFKLAAIASCLLLLMALLVLSAAATPEGQFVSTEGEYF